MIHRKKERRWCRWGNYIQQNKLQQQTKWYLVDYLSSEGERLEKSGREWRWLRHDSITIRGNQWYRHKEQRGGFRRYQRREGYLSPIHLFTNRQRNHRTGICLVRGH